MKDEEQRLSTNRDNMSCDGKADSAQGAESSGPPDVSFTDVVARREAKR